MSGSNSLNESPDTVAPAGQSRLAPVFTRVQIAFSVVLTFFLGVVLAATLGQRGEEWLFYGSVLVACAAGSLLGVAGRRFAILGAMISGAIGVPFGLGLAMFVDGNLSDPRAFAMVVGLGVIGAIGGLLFGGIVALFLPLIKGSLDCRTNGAGGSASCSGGPRPSVFRLLLKTALLTFVVVAAFVSIGRTVFIRPPSWKYDGQFHKAIAEADRIVIRDGGFGCHEPVEKNQILCEVTDPSEIKEVFDNIEFKENQNGLSCACCGYPGLDWYTGQRRIALTAVQHGRAIRWEGFKGDATLTRKSGDWLVRWLEQKGAAADKVR